MRRVISLHNGTINNLTKLEFSDGTLREGELSPGACFTYEDRFKIIHQLDKLGVTSYTVGMFGANKDLPKEEFEFMEKACALNLSIKTSIGVDAMIPNAQNILTDKVIPLHPDCIGTLIGTTPFVNNGSFTEKERDDLLSKVVRFVADVKSRLPNVKVSVGLMDSSRARIEDLEYLITRISESGADGIGIVDTVGAATPEAIKFLVGLAVEIASKNDCQIGIHCHNDFGLSLANVLAAIQAGARGVSGCINGMGDRCGDASIGEIAAALEILYGVDTGINLKLLKETSELLEELSGVPVPYNAPLVGKYAFSHQQDFHIRRLMTDPNAFQSVSAEEFGSRTEIIFGKMTGYSALQYMRENENVDIPKELEDTIIKELARLDVENKGHVINVNEFKQIVTEIKNKK